jgi:hypothetical protein
MFYLKISVVLFVCLVVAGVLVSNPRITQARGGESDAAVLATLSSYKEWTQVVKPQKENGHRVLVFENFAGGG